MTEQAPGQMGLDEINDDWRIKGMPKADGYDDDTRDGTVQDEIEGTVVEVEESRALVAQPQQHLVVGVGALAAMPDDEFERNLAMLTKGQDRLQILTDKLLTRGVDYGHVPGIAKPFLQKPGAEKLANFYGLAVRFEADRLVGDGVKSPQLTYHVRAYVHLGSFDGPIVNMGEGEANCWEERYRYVTQRPICPACGKVELVMRKSPPNLAGKLNCPTWQNKGGCNAVFEPGDPRVPQSGKIENPDIWGLANTLIKMAEKRAHVDAVLRATGTSGFFTQDEDSPSVREQSGEAPPPPPEEAPKPEKAETPQVERGGKEVGATKPQIDRLRALSKEKDLGPEKIAAVITRVTGKEVTLGDGDRRQQGVRLAAFLTGSLTADEMGTILAAIETGEVPPAEEAAAVEVPAPEMESAL